MKSVVLLFFSLLCGLISAEVYNNTLVLNENYVIYWNIVSDEIHLKLQANTTGWVGFGIGEQVSGSMPGSDIVVAMVLDDGSVEITDRYATQYATPQEDYCSHWSVISGTEQNGVTTVELTRKLDTGDSQDRPIGVGLTKIVHAYGSSDVLAYHEDHRWVNSVTFIPDPNQFVPDQDGWVPLDFSSTYNVPNNSTVYSCTTYTVDLPEDVHVVRFDMLVDPANHQFVHHLVLYRCIVNNTEWYQRRLNSTQLCDIPGEPRDSNCNEAVWIWAHGAYTYYVPENIGFMMGPSTDSMKYLMVQIHYDNPTQQSGIVDSSAVRLTYTTNLREYSAGTMTLGDIRNNGKPIPPGIALNEYEYECPSECTVNLPWDINVFASIFHMHALGARGWTRWWRDTQDLGYLDRTEYYSYGLQTLVPRNGTIKAGDRLNTHCVYDSTAQSGDTIFGEASEDEMCLDFVMYYPRVPKFAYCGYGLQGNKNYTWCGSSSIPISNPEQVDPVGGIYATFGPPEDSCNSNPIEHLNAPSSTTTASTTSDAAVHFNLVILFVASLFMLL